MAAIVGELMSLSKGASRTCRD